MKRISVLLVLFSFLYPMNLISQESEFGNWLIYIGNKKLNQKWDIHHEVQYRSYNVVDDLEQLLLRTGLGYTFNEGRNNFLLGYGFIHSQNYVGDINEKTKVDEHRIFQQFTAKQSVGSFNLSHRYRFEQRFIEDDFKLRLRYFLGVNRYFKKNEEEISNLYLSVYNEIFLSTESPIFDRNRLYGGLGYKINDNIRMEVGYMNQFFESSGRDQLNIITFVNF